MKGAGSHQDRERQRESRAFTFLASLLLHGIVVLGIMGTSWFWGTSRFERVSAHTVSLVDAPLSLTKSPSPVVPPPPKMPPKNRDDAPANAPKTPTETQKEETPAPPVEVPVTPPKEQAVKKSAKPDAQPLQKNKPSKSKASPVPSQAEAPKVKPKPPPPAKPATATTSKEARSAIDRLRQQQKRQEAARQEAVLAQQRSAANRIESLRERLAQAPRAGDQTDAMSGLQRVRFAAYQERVRTKIIQAWVLPLPPEQSQAMQATVLFRVRRNGHVDGLELVKSSGNSLFDASLVRAIHRASPLPELPGDYPKDLLEVEMRFSAREPSTG